MTSEVPDSRVVLKSVEFVLEGKTILDALSFSEEVNRLGVVGRNGSGKSTLARLLSGLIEPSSGSITINGHNIAADRRSAMQEVGVLFQNPEHQIIFPTVLEEITFGLIQLGSSKTGAENKARSALTDFDKTHWAEAYVSALSQGQKHLLCIMAVVAMSPKLLVLDEPFAGLDIPTKVQLMRHLNLYKGNMVHITHDPNDLSGYERVLWLEQGKVKDIGPSKKVLSEYLDSMTRIGGTDDITDLAS